MKNLEKFGVQELDAKEIQETDGGFLPTLLGALLAYAIIDAVEHPNDFWAGVSYTTSIN